MSIDVKYQYLNSGQRYTIYRAMLPHVGTDRFPEVVTELIGKYGVRGSVIYMIWFEHRARARTKIIAEASQAYDRELIR